MHITGDTSMTGTTTSSGLLTVSSSDADITGLVFLRGNTSITGTTTSSGLLTVSGGGASITGNTTINGTTTLSAALTINESGALIKSSYNPILSLKHTNLTQGIEFGYNTISISGTNPDQDITIIPKGVGKVIMNNLKITNRNTTNYGAGTASSGTKYYILDFNQVRLYEKLATSTNTININTVIENGGIFKVFFQFDYAATIDTMIRIYPNFTTYTSQFKNTYSRNGTNNNSTLNTVEIDMVNGASGTDIVGEMTVYNNNGKNRFDTKATHNTAGVCNGCTFWDTSAGEFVFGYFNLKNVNQNMNNMRVWIRSEI